MLSALILAAVAVTAFEGGFSDRGKKPEKRSSGTYRRTGSDGIERIVHWEDYGYARREIDQFGEVTDVYYNEDGEEVE